MMLIKWQEQTFKEAVLSNKSKYNFGAANPTRVMNVVQIQLMLFYSDY